MSTVSVLRMQPNQAATLTLYESMGADGCALHATARYSVAGQLDKEAAARATQMVASRHRLLSSHFVLADKTIRPAAGPILLWREVENIEAEITAFARQLFSLGQEPPWRVAVFEEDEQLEIVFVAHAVACDRRSTVVLVEDWAASYTAARDGRATTNPETPMSGPSERASPFDSDHFWQSRLTAIDSQALPIDLGSRLSTWQFAQHITASSKLAFADVRTSAKVHRCSVFVLLASVTSAALARLSPSPRRHILFSMEIGTRLADRNVDPRSGPALLTLAGDEPDALRCINHVKRDLLTVLGHRGPSMEHALTTLDHGVLKQIRGCIGSVVLDFRSALPDLDLGLDTVAVPAPMGAGGDNPPRTLVHGLDFSFAEEGDYLLVDLAYNPESFSVARANRILDTVLEALLSVLVPLQEEDTTSKGGGR